MVDRTLGLFGCRTKVPLETRNSGRRLRVPASINGPRPTAMQLLIFRFTALTAACALAACSTVTVTTDYDRSAPFAKYKIYSLAPPAQGQTLSPASEAALRDALRTELARRGISEAAGGQADLAIVRHVFLEEKVSVQQYTTWGYGYAGWPYGYGHYGMWAGAPRTFTDVSEYTEGTMVLDFVDTRSKKLVFRGTGTAVVSGPESNAAKIREAVAKIVAGFPRQAAR
jgi:Domain of unknown function (DUF4136)